MPRPAHRRLLRALTAAVLASSSILIFAAPSLATGGGGPTYKAVVSPATAAAGTSVTSTITLTQLVNDDWWGNKKVGSVKVTPPAGFSITSASAARGSTSLAAVIASGTVTVNDIDLKHAGKTATVTVSATVACGVSGAKSWGVVAHQTSSFTSPYAKDLVRSSASQLTTTVSSCSLAFVTGRQPAAAGIGQTITSVAGAPSGPAIQVQLLDGNGSPRNQPGVPVSLAIEAGTGTPGAVLGGTTAGSTGISGLVSFAPTIDRSGEDYRLRASDGAGIGSAVSTTFGIDAVVQPCAGACSGTTQLGDTTATVSGASNGGLLSMSLGIDEIDCNNAANGFYVGTSEVLSFTLTPASGRITVTMKLAAASVTKLFLKYEVCFSSPESTFVNKLGVTIPADQAGILPWCPNVFKPSGGPCVVAKLIDFHHNVIVKFSVPQSDPRGQI